MTKGENDALRVADQNGRNQPENQFRTHNLRGKSANNGARYGPNFAYSPRGAQVDRFSCRRGATKRAPISPRRRERACTYLGNLRLLPRKETEAGRLPKLPISAPIW